MKTNKEMEKLFNELVPVSGKADTVAGEIVRAYTRLRYRFYNDGDMVDIKEGKETCNAPARYLIDNGNSNIAVDASDLWSQAKMWDNEKDYERSLEFLGCTIVKYIAANPQLKTTPNDVDMWDYYIEENDTWHDYDEEDDDWF